MNKILIVEDDEDIAKLIKFNLESEGYIVEIVYDGLSAVDSVKANPPDLMLLDNMLPKLDGKDVLKIIRRDYDFPIIFVSAKSMEIDKVLGFELGADDYISKPFSILELKARVKASLRRVYTNTNDSHNILRAGDLLLNKSEHTVKLNNEYIELRPKEFAILELLMSNKGRVFSRDVISERVWGDDWVDEGTIDVHIRRLRMKVDPENSNTKHIITVRSIGYKFNNEL